MMRDSRMPDDWIERAVADNPIVKIVDPKTGQWSGNIRTCPVRLSYFNNALIVAHAGNNDNGGKNTPMFEVQMLFPPCATAQIEAVMAPEVLAVEKARFPQNIDPATGRSFGLHSPFRDQGEKRQYGGYTPGAIVITAKTQYKPQIVDSAGNPIVDESRAYPGVWALVSVNLFHYGISPPRPKKGVSFGLQAVMLIADDNKLGGGAVDAKTQFVGVKIDAKFDPAGAFGASRPPPAPSGGLLRANAPPPPFTGNPDDLV